jgi:hypothetical protein
MCAIYVFGLLLGGWGLSVLTKGEVTISRQLTGPTTLRGHAATILGIVWTAIGASTLLVALFSGAAVQLVAQLPDEVRFLVGCVRGISLCTVVAGIVVFVVTMLIILSLPGGEDSDGDEADTA